MDRDHYYMNIAMAVRKKANCMGRRVGRGENKKGAGLWIPAFTGMTVFFWIPAPRFKHTGTSFAGMTEEKWE